MQAETEHNLKILRLDDDIFNTQKCYLSSLLFEKFNSKFKSASYVLIPISPYQTCVCKLYCGTNLHESFCEVDISVLCFSKDDGTSPRPSPIATAHMYKLPSTYKEIGFKFCDMSPLPSAVPLTNISVTPVMMNIHDCSRWKKCSTILCDVLTDILKLYVVTNNSVVYLKNLNNVQRFGIHCIIVNDLKYNHGSGDSLLVGKVTSSTTINIVDIVSKVKFDQVHNATLVQTLGGLDGPYNILKDIIVASKKKERNQAVQKLGLHLSQQVLLVGPSGCGKTSLVRKTAADCGATVVTVLGPEVCRPLPGETEAQLRRVFAEATGQADEGCCVLLLDEVDSLCPERSDCATPNGARVTSQLLALLEEVGAVVGLVVVATTNRPHALDRALRRHGRLETEIQIGVPNERERADILSALVAPLGIPDPGELCEQVARLTPGYVGADLALVCQDVMLRRFTRTKQEPTYESTMSQSWVSDFRSAVSNIRPALLRGGLGVVMSSPVSLSKIGGLGKVKQTLRATVEWPLTHPEAFARLGLPQPKGVLLYGPPGCAKTTIAQAIALANNTNFLSVSAAALYSPFVGDAEKKIGELFHRARLGAPSIVFIDEIDALVGSRSEREKGVQERVLSALLTEMDGIGVRLDDSVNTSRKVLEGEALETNLQVESDCVTNRGVVVIGATNRPDMLDSALLRPGRFDKLVHVPAPDVEDRLDILRQIVANMPLDSDVDLSALAQETHLFSGADLGNLIKEAGLCALTENGMDVKCINQIHFLYALQKVRPSLTQEQVDWYLTYR